MKYEDFKKLPVDEAINMAAQYSGFDPTEIKGVWGTESAYGSNKGPSKAGALGDFQIMPTTQKALEQRLGIQFDPMDFHDSLYMGMEVLRENLSHFGNKEDALRAYNGGWDKAKWDNPETAAYPGKVLGTAEQQLTATYAATNSLPTFTKTSIRGQALEESGLVDQTGMGEISPDFQDIYQPDIMETGLYDEDALRLSNERQYAGFTEAALDSMVHNTITGKLVEVWNRGEADPNFDPVSKENRERIQQAGLYGNDQMMDYVTGARNAEDFNSRLAVAKERTEMFSRLNNNQGISGTAGMFLGSMADPIGVAASVGMGAGVAAMRGAAAASRAAIVARSGAAGAAENIAAGVIINESDNQRFSWSQAIADGVMGAGLGAVGGLAVRNDGRLYNNPEIEVPPDFMPMMTAASRAIQEAHGNIMGRAWDEGLTRSTADVGGTWDGTVSTNIADFGGSSIGELPARGPVRVVDTEGGGTVVKNYPKQSDFSPSNGYSSALGYRPAPTLTSREYVDLHNNGVITELRSADDLSKVSGYQRSTGDEIPADAKAVYIPQDDRVYVFRDRISQAEADNPMGLVMHEVGVHYGLERAIGTDNYKRVLESLDKSNDARIKSALGAVPADTPAQLRLEEALGYLVEKHPELAPVKKIISDIRNWLRENVPMLRDLAVTADDAIAYVRGSVDRARKEGRITDRQAADTARYSRSTSLVSQQPLNPREQLVKERLDGINAAVDPNQEAQIRRTQAWMDSRPEALKNMEKWAQSPGVVMASSPNEYARKASAMLFENAMGSAGRPEDGSVAIQYDLLFRAYRDTTMEKARPLILGLMTPKERTMHLLGGTNGFKRISTEVAVERQKHRMAVREGRKYVSSAPEGIQQLAKLLDDQMFRMVDDGRAVGSEYARSVFASGVVGFAPQVWNWRKFHAAQTTDPQVWEALKANFRQQYIEKQVDPVWEKMLDDGVDPMEMQAVRERLLAQVEHQVNTRLNESVTDPNTRSNQDTSKFETMAAEILEEQFKGMAVSDDVIKKFKEVMADHRKDRSRTEFDLLREVNGVRLLDYVEHDLVTTISHTAHRFAGQNAMAKRGFKDAADFEAMINVLRKTGARPVDIELAKFAGRSFGFGEMVIGDSAFLATLRNFVYASMLGKLGFAQLADLSAVLSATGVSSLARILGKGLSRESPIVKQLGEMFGPGFVGADYRIQSFIADVQPNGRSLTGFGERMLKVSQRGAQAVSWVSGSNHVTRVLHKAFLPIMAENVVRAARGLDGGMNARRLADAGLSEETLARIRKQLEKHEPNRKEGDAFNWEAWDDQYAADKLVEAMHRVTSQVFNRSLVGEAAPWRSESQLGALIAQFHNYGMTAMEKQLGRNLAINDINTYTSMAIGLAWSTLLYYSRLHANTMGMSTDQAQEYMERNTTPARLTQGMLTFFNMSGVGAEVFGMGEVLFGGNSYQAGSGPVAAMGYIMNATRAANAAGSIITGQSEDVGKDFGTMLKIIPGGNSIPATWGINALRDD